MVNDEKKMKTFYISYFWQGKVDHSGPASYIPSGYGITQVQSSKIDPQAWREEMEEIQKNKIVILFFSEIPQ